MSITQRGQVTLPVEVMKLLGVKPRGKVAFQIDGENIKLVSPSLTLDAIFGSVRAKNEVGLEESIALAKEEKAERSMK